MFFAGMNIIDLLAIMPFYIELIQLTNVPKSSLQETESKTMFMEPMSSASSLQLEEEVERVGGIDDVLQVFRIFKLARILKLARSH